MPEVAFSFPSPASVPALALRVQGMEQGSAEWECCGLGQRHVAHPPTPAPHFLFPYLTFPVEEKEEYRQKREGHNRGTVRWWGMLPCATLPPEVAALHFIGKPALPEIGAYSRLLGSLSQALRGPPMLGH